MCARSEDHAGQEGRVQPPGQRGPEANPEALRAFGFQRVISFVTLETADDSDGLLVTVYEVDDPAVLERFYGLEAVVEQERRAHGPLVAEHDHQVVPQNVAFLDLRLNE